MFDLTRFVTNTATLPVETFEWGTLQWLCNATLSPGAQQTMGLCHIRPGRRNPRHHHPNCEEVLHLLAGHGLHSFEDDQVELTIGMTIRIPVGVTHNLTNIGDEPLVCLITFNSGERETVFLEG